MNSVCRATWLACVITGSAAAAPQIWTNGIVNGASFVYYGLPNGDIAQGSIFSIFGGSLAAATTKPDAFPLPATLGDATVEITASDSKVYNAVMLAVNASQINAILPSTVPLGPATVVVKVAASGTSNSQQINVVKNSIGVFAANQQGYGPAVLDNFYPDSTPRNTIFVAAHPGEVVILWATGLGAVTFPDNELPGSRAADMTDSTGAMVYVGGLAIKPAYAGRQSQFAGLDQINFKLPDDIAVGCYVPVTVKVNGIVSNTTTMSITSGIGRICSDDLMGFDPSKLNNGLKFGRLGVVRNAYMDGTHISDSASGVFNKTDTSTLRIYSGMSTYGTCVVEMMLKTPPGVFPTAPLDAGPQLTLTLPDGSSKAMPQGGLLNQSGVYRLQEEAGQSAQPFLDQTGVYKVVGPGGKDVGPFTATLKVPTEFTWSNEAGITDVLRGTPLLITWQNANADDVITITGISSLKDGTAATFSCHEKASKNQFWVPADVLSALPASYIWPDGQPRGSLSVWQTSNPASTKIDPVPVGLDSATFSYQFVFWKSVNYQ